MSTTQRDLNIIRTIREWKALGISDIFITNTQVNGRNRCRIQVGSRAITFAAFAKRFPYAVNPSL